ncbi:MAG: DUF4835 family protein [Salinibacter sp.]|uniref:type IX secretion system protein PorD n=1 Tax=Salinibacter sp. TaxID=2065818 RepID=UPI0035D4051B
MSKRPLVAIVGRKLKTSCFVALLAMGIIAGPAVGQELDCRVQVDRSQLSGSEFSFLDDLEQQVQEYLNRRRWTDDQYRPHERISCSMQIVISESVSLSEFKAQLIVTSRRPIYGTAQSTVVLRVNDTSWRFEYSRGKTFRFDLDQYDSLTSVLDFYAYLILGYDYDTFSPLGGTPYFEKARTVSSQAEDTGDPGWSSVGVQQNRAKLISNLLDQRHKALRRVYYKYHRKVLDRFVKETSAARKTALDVLKSLRSLNQKLSGSYALDLFFSTKYEELTALFAKSDLSSRAHSLLVQIDPSHSSEYGKLVE